jgi:hypothetical protein
MKEDSFRENLSLFNLNQIAIQHRNQFVKEILIPMLHGKLFCRKSLKSIGYSQKRKSILSYFGNFTPEELGYFFTIVLEPFNNNNDNDIILSKRKQTGFLNLVSDLIKQLATKLNDNLHNIIKPILFILNYNLKLEKSEETLEITNDCLKKFSLVLDRFPNFSYGNFLIEFYEIIEPSLQNLIENKKEEIKINPISILECFITISTHLIILRQVLKLIPNFNLNIIQIISPNNAKFQVINKVFEIVENLLEFQKNSQENSEENILSITEIHQMLDNLQYFILSSKR